MKNSAAVIELEHGERELARRDRKRLVCDAGNETPAISLEDFGVDTKSRVFTSSIDWTPNSRVTVSTGYNYNWLNSDAVIDDFFNSVLIRLGTACTS